MAGKDNNKGLGSGGGGGGGSVKRNNGIRITENLWGGITTSFGIIDLSTSISRFFNRIRSSFLLE